MQIVLVIINKDYSLSWMIMVKRIVKMILLPKR